jgi:hypothetical protein
MTFKPERKKSKTATSTRADRMICVDVGVERKKMFCEYCKTTGLSQTEMFRQMLDYCMKGLMT